MSRQCSMTSAVARRWIVASLAAAVVSAAVLGARAASARAAGADDKPIVVFAAASLKGALDAAAAKWTAEGGPKVTISYAASGALARQIENGAPADLFASADTAWMNYLAERRLVRAEGRRDLLGNALVLIAPKDAAVSLDIKPGVDFAPALGTGRLAMGVPGTVPAGTYAKASLTALGVWPALERRIAGAESVRAALAYVARGEAPLGIVYRTDAHDEPAVKIVGVFPPDTHPPIVYPFALTVNAGNPAAARFLDFLAAPETAPVFSAAGFSVPSAAR